MKVINKTIISSNEPTKDSIWVHKVGNTYVQQMFLESGWTTIGIDVNTARTGYGENGEVLTTITTPVFYITSTDTNLMSDNISTAASLGHNKYQTVLLKGEQYGEAYDVTGYFHNGIIHTLIGEFDVNYNTGAVTIIYKDDNTTAAPLQVADSDTPEAGENLKILMAMSIYPVFLCRFSTGYGTATFNSNDGGEAYIITAAGHGVKYTINEDGSIVKSTEYNLSDELIEM